MTASSAPIPRPTRQPPPPARPLDGQMADMAPGGCSPAARSEGFLHRPSAGGGRQGSGRGAALPRPTSDHGRSPRPSEGGAGLDGNRGRQGPGSARGRSRWRESPGSTAASRGSRPCLRRHGERIRDDGERCGRAQPDRDPAVIGADMGAPAGPGGQRFDGRALRVLPGGSGERPRLGRPVGDRHRVPDEQELERDAAARASAGRAASSSTEACPAPGRLRATIRIERRGRRYRRHRGAGDDRRHPDLHVHPVA